MIPLFDLGNVVLKLDFSGFESWVSERATVTYPEGVMGRLGPSSLWHDFEFGNIDSLEFTRRVGAIFGTNFDAHEFQHKFCSIFPGTVPGISDLLSELSGRVYCLTNTNKMHYDFITHRFQEMKHFAKVFASHEMRMRKPWPGTYQAVADWMGVSPREVIFFDDVGANVEGARKAGMRAFLFEGTEAAKRILEEEA